MTPANYISTLRILLIIPFVIAMYQHGDYVEAGQFMSTPRQIAMWLFGIISISDALDGWVARITNQKSELGAILDAAADKLLMLAATVTLTVASWNASEPSLPYFWVTIVLLRDSLITFLTSLLWIKKCTFNVKPTLFAKLCTITQFIMIAYVMIFTQHPVPLFIYITSSFFTVGSGFYYLKIGYDILLKNR